MKKRIRIALFAICVVIGMNFLLIGYFRYAVDHRKTIRDTSVSPDGKYELTLIEIGEPVWPFGPASGRLTLKEGDNQINQADFELKNDGCSISSNCWTVAWMTDYVEVVLSGDEQLDEQILLYFDGSTQRQTLDNEAKSTASQVETGALDIQVMENRKNELVFTISTSDYVESYNSYYKIDYCRSLLPPVSQWQCFTYDSAIHSEYETKCYSFTEDEHVYSLPTITVYVPTNDDYIQQITVNFDEHSFTQSGFEQYKEMCYYTMKVFFPDLPDARIMDLCTEIVALGNQNVFSSDEWFSKNAVPFALFYREGIGVYPYFAIGDWEHFCIIPVTEEAVTEFGEKGVQIHEIS